MTIKSSQNPLIKQAKQLRLAKYRQRTGQTILVGEKIITDYLLGGYKVEQLLVTEKLANSKLLQNNLVDRPVVVSESLARQISPLENNADMLAVVKIPKYDVEVELNRVASEQRSILLIDRVQDPGNLGNIIRTALAVDLGSVMLSPGSVDPWSPKVIRASAGGVFNLPILTNIDLAKLIITRKLTVFATALEQSDNLYQLDLRQPIAWLVGNEGQGVDLELLKLAAQRVKIPQSIKIESLNLASATAICLYEQFRQNNF